MRTILFLVMLMALPALAQGRLESEYKLVVPPGQWESVWEYLNLAYGPESTLLRQLGPDFTATFATEEFLDLYYDTASLSLLKNEFGLRFRSRVIIEGKDRRKDGRQLLQLKLSSGSNDRVVRQEFKFKARDNPFSIGSVEDSVPVVGLVRRSERADLRRHLDALSIEARDLQKIVSLLQVRRRAYISRKGKAFATITLDGVVARRGLTCVSFDEMELELNEIAFTDADPATRELMTSQNTIMRDDLFKKFPGLSQDQTPKYNKAVALIKERTLFFETSLRWGIYPDAIALTMLLLAAGFLSHWLYRRVKGKRDLEG